MDIELKALIVFSVILIIAGILALNIEWLIDKISKRFNIKPDNSFTFPSSQQFYELYQQADLIERREDRIANSQKKHNHKTASNSRKIRGRANG